MTTDDVTKNDGDGNVIALRKQVAEMQYKLKIAEQLLRRVHVDHDVIELANDAGRVGGASSRRYARSWARDRDAWLRAQS